LGDYPKGADSLVKRIVEDLSEAGFNARVHEQIMRAKWGKLIANLNNATNAITDIYLQRALSDQKHRLFMAEVMEEGIAAADLAGVELDDGGIFDARAMAAALRQPPKEEAKWKMSDSGRTYPSTWQDLMLGRRQTETRFFNGEIVGLAATAGMKTPYNAVLFETVERMAAAGEKPGRCSLEDLKEMIAVRRREMEA
jgi:2-dehydropantoate 2-reductase